MKKALPTGVVNYRELRTADYYVVDKSLMMKELLERKSKVTLITRPRRFGKTLNMNMLAEFFDITKDSKELFKDTKITGTKYVTEMNQYPTIFISFANAKGNKMRIVKAIKQELLREYKKFKFVLKDIDKFDKSSYNLILESMNNLTDESLDNIDNALAFLMNYIEMYYHKKVMLFIDEYDTPFIEAHVNKFYDDIKSGLSSLLHNTLKDNEFIQYAMLTGIQRVAKENVFSDLNNLDVYTVKDKAYAEYFGFTKEETIELLTYYDLEYNDKVKEMYDGYRMGTIDIYNPWSIINYAKNKELDAYWVNTSSNNMIKKAMSDSEPSFHDGFEKLILNGYLDTEINMGTSFYEQSNTPSLWGLFVNAGYLTITEIKSFENQEYRVRIPNKEVVSEFKSLVAYYLHVDTKDLSDLYKSIRLKDQKLFYTAYGRILLVNPSFYDLISENSYQMFLLGICLYAKNEYELFSNKEEGTGRCDIILKAKKKALPSYVIELKYMKKEEYEKNKESLRILAREAINQIDQKKYDAELEGEIIYIGLAHSGKDVEIEWCEKEDYKSYRETGRY